MRGAGAFGRRWRAAAIVAVAAAVLLAWLGLHRFWRRQLSHFTGPAEWIWVTDALRERRPTTGLFVSEIVLQGPVSQAVLKVCGDREYVVYVNGTPAGCGWSRPGFRLDLYDVGHLLRQGDNQLAVEVRSPTPVGGLLLALDIAGLGSNVLTSGPAFTLRREFDLSPLAPDDVGAPVRWGLPPQSPWGYPRPVPHPRTLDAVVVEEAVVLTGGDASDRDGRRSFRLDEERLGYVWLHFDCEGDSSVVPVGGGDDQVDRVPVIRLPGQRRYLLARPYRAREIVVEGHCLPTAVEIWPIPPDLLRQAPGAAILGDEE